MTTTTTIERPILFSGPMIRAILDGLKTQTRRVILHRHAFKTHHEKCLNSEVEEARRAPLMLPQKDYKEAVAYLETHCPYGKPGDHLWVRETWKEGMTIAFHYRATASEELKKVARWRPSIFMPRAACRIKLEIEKISVERLKDITWNEARREGMEEVGPHAVRDFRVLWDSLNKKRGFGWEKNPWVWVLEFRRIK
jgi:hypothetical protein